MPRGHHQQRAVELDMADASLGEPVRSDVPSALETKLVTKWVWGRIEGTDVADIALASVLDSGESHPNVCRLAALGGFGNSSQHVSEQLFNIYGSQAATPTATEVRAPVLDPQDPEHILFQDVPMFLFHEWLVTLSRNYEDDYNRMFGVLQAPQFWHDSDKSRS